MIRRRVNKEELRKQLERCDYEMALTLIRHRFSEAGIPKEYADCLYAFISNPCPDTAISLIECEPEFAAFFEYQENILLEATVQQLEGEVKDLKNKIIQLQTIIRDTTRDLVRVGGLFNDLLFAVESGNKTDLKQAAEALRKWLDKYGI